MIYGWDLGGAHIKLAVLDREGRLHRVAQAPCELWMGVEHLEAALAQMLSEPVRNAVHAVTMTGELADVFMDRAAGVAAITDSFVRMSGAADAMFFTGEGFVGRAEARRAWQSIASANWQSIARLAAQLVPEALLLDVGSTTTDIIVIADHSVQARGSDDHDRLALEELVYTGAVRTPLMALAQRVPFAGGWVGMMAEHFATTADLYRITGQLDAAFDQARTADGRGRSKEDSMRRLARMLGCDLANAPAREWERLAGWLADAQQQQVRRACDRQFSRGLLSDAAPVIGLGVGRFIATRIAQIIGREYVDFAALAGVAPEHGGAVDVCGPAFAVARLARNACQ
jgi:probable H4MPT-linked C1 transfer pathway protein